LQPAANSFEENLNRLDLSLRELKIRYDQFFGGGLDREPLELRRRVDRLVRQMTAEPPQKYALRFRFNTLVGRYHSFSELWGRTLRTREEGDYHAESQRERLGLKHRILGRCLVTSTEAADAELRRLHGRFAAARERQGQSQVSFEKFARGIAGQARRLRSKHECGQIEVRLVESEDGVQIRARPGR
jgi:hypothetical protein